MRSADKALRLSMGAKSSFPRFWGCWIRAMINDPGFYQCSSSENLLLSIHFKFHFSDVMEKVLIKTNTNTHAGTELGEKLE